MIRISVLIIASILLLSIVISSEEAKSDSSGESFRQIENRRTIMNPQNENSKQVDLKAVRTSGAVYSIVTRNRTPRVRPGGKVEIEVFLSGYGMPEKNKLYIQLSSPYVLDKKDAGVLIFRIKFAINKVTGETQPIVEIKDPQTHKLKQAGATVILNEGYFLEKPLKPEDKKPPNSEISRIMSEQMFNDEPPILLIINTDKDAPSGDYNVTLTFTYGNEQDLLQDQKVVPFHITSRWERSQGWVIPISIFGIIIAFFSLLITAIGTISRICRGP